MRAAIGEPVLALLEITERGVIDDRFGEGVSGREKQSGDKECASESQHAFLRVGLELRSTLRQSPRSCHSPVGDHPAGA